MPNDAQKKKQTEMSATINSIFFKNMYFKCKEMICNICFFDLSKTKQKNRNSILSKLKYQMENTLY